MDDFDDDEEGDEGGLFRRRMILQEVTCDARIYVEIMPYFMFILTADNWVWTNAMLVITFS